MTSTRLHQLFAQQGQSPWIDNLMRTYLTQGKLAEMVGELYLSEGRKLDRLWTRVGETLARLEFPASRIEHLLQKRDPALLAGVMKELEGTPG